TETGNGVALLEKSFEQREALRLRQRLAPASFIENDAQGRIGETVHAFASGAGRITCTTCSAVCVRMLRTCASPGKVAPAAVNSPLTARGKQAAIFRSPLAASSESLVSRRADISQRSGTASNSTPELARRASTSDLTSGGTTRA